MGEWNEKREIMHNYDDSSIVYEGQYAEEQKTKMVTIFSDVNPKKDSFVLDVGCGTGLLFKHIDEAVKLLVGLDSSLRSLIEAKKAAKRCSNVTLILADADFMPFRNSVFNDVFAITLLQNMPNPCLTLREIKRVSQHRSVIVVTGLKKRFSQSSFIRLIKRAGLKPAIIKANERLKGYIAVIKNE